MSDMPTPEEAQTPEQQLRDFLTAEIGPLLAGRDLSEGGAYVKACHEIADALAPWVVPMAVKAAQRDRMVGQEPFPPAPVERQAWERPHRPPVPGDRVASMRIHLDVDSEGRVRLHEALAARLLHEAGWERTT